MNIRDIFEIIRKYNPIFVFTLYIFNMAIPGSVISELSLEYADSSFGIAISLI